MICNVLAVPGTEGMKCWVHDVLVDKVTDVVCVKSDQPATSEPVHVMDQPNRMRSVHGARAITAGSRPIVVHMGCEGEPGHFTERGQPECWCGPVTIPSG